MTYIDEPEIRRPSRGTKVLAFGFGVLAVLGSFWGIVWFIRSYVEPPRVLRPSPLALASRDSVPVPPPASAESKRSEPVTHRAMTVSTPATIVSAAPAERTASNGAIADRWSPLTQSAATVAIATSPAPVAPPSATATASVAADPAPAPTMSAAPSSAATSFATAPDTEANEDVALSFVPAIVGRAPLPRRRPATTITASAAAAAAKRNAEPPLPRPRPDGPAPQSVFTGVPVTDDRFPTQ